MDTSKIRAALHDDEANHVCWAQVTVRSLCGAVDRLARENTELRKMCASYESFLSQAMEDK